MSLGWYPGSLRRIGTGHLIQLKGHLFVTSSRTWGGYLVGTSSSVVGKRGSPSTISFTITKSFNSLNHPTLLGISHFDK